MCKIEPYCLKCKQNTENIDSKILSNGKAMISNCAICGSKKIQIY